MVELRSEKTVETTLKRMGSQLATIFRESPVEVFIPVFHRDFNEFELKTGNYVFVRSPNFQALLRLKSITGIVGLVTLGESNHPSKVIPVDNEYVQLLIKEAEDFFQARAATIAVGSFVRILDGEQRDFCGTVIVLNDGMACVQVEIKTKLLLVETPVRNLLNLDAVPPQLRVFYYSPLVLALSKDGLESLIAEDLKFEEPPASADDGLDVEQSKKHGRQQTVTALVKRLIITGVTAPKKICAKVCAALKEDRLRSPKNLSIVHGIIKHRLILDHFKRIDPTVESYREVVTKFGPSWKFPLQDLVNFATGLSLPIHSEEQDAKDRLREELIARAAPPPPPLAVPSKKVRRAKVKAKAKVKVTPKPKSKTEAEEASTGS
jgi:hypothetical protein